MEQLTINKHHYVFSDDIIENAPVFCKGIRNGRELIKKKELDSKNYLFARLIDNKWEIKDGRSIKFDKVLIRKSYADKIEELDQTKKEIEGIEKAPAIINLEDHEKFQDNDSNVVEIETRGDRTVNGIYFRVKDVSIVFDMKSLIKNIDDKKSWFNINEDYKYFYCKNIRKISEKNKNKKTLFLTYSGVLRVLFASHSQIAKRFVKWATEKLFTIQMGTKEDKQKLAKDLMGVPIEISNQFLNNSSSKISCIYLLTLGTVKSLRQSMNIDEKYPDDHVVNKFGYTDDLKSRQSQHMTTYGKIKGCELKTKYFVYVDSAELKKAEKTIKHFVKDEEWGLKYESNKELFVVSTKDMKRVIDKYDIISHKFKGNCSELINLRNIEDEKHKCEVALLKEQHMIELLKVKHEVEKEQYENKLLLEKDKLHQERYNSLKQEIEIMKLKQLLADKK